LLIVAVEEARAGMRLAAPVLHPERPGQELLRQGYSLEPPVIERLREIGVEFIYVEYPALESLDRHLAVYLSPARQNLLKQIRGAIARSQKETRPAISYDDYCSTTRELITTLLTQGQNPVYLDQMSRQGADAVAHAAAVAHLSLLLGIRLENYIINQRSRLPPSRAKDVVNLGVAAMLHDIGLSKLPEELQRYCDVDRPDDDKLRSEWESHAAIGYEMIRNDVEASAAAAVYQHHQHFNGSGFPELPAGDGRAAPMEADRIHVFARIILCANLYDRLASPPRGRGRLPPLQIHHRINNHYLGWCDPAILRVLQAVAPPLPPGLRVRLSDGTRAVISDVNIDAPMKPVVRRLADDNWTPEGEPLDLRQPGAPTIEPDPPALRQTG